MLEGIGVFTDDEVSRLMLPPDLAFLVRVTLKG